MKKETLIRLALAIPLAILMASTSAQAQSLRRSYPVSTPRSSSVMPKTEMANSRSSAVATTSSQGGSALGVGSQGQSLSIDSHAIYQAQERNPVATAVAPPLSSSNDTCMGSSSIAGSAVSFGVSFGTTWTDTNCVMLKNAREIWNMGFKGAALARLCMDDLNKEALEATGIICPQRQQNKQNRATGSSMMSDAGESYRY